MKTLKTMNIHYAWKRYEVMALHILYVDKGK